MLARSALRGTSFSSCGSLRRHPIADRRLDAASPELYSGLRPSGLFRLPTGLLCTEAFDPHNRRCTQCAATRPQPAVRSRRHEEVQGRLGQPGHPIGRIVAAPELRETASGKHVTTVRIATNGRKNAEFHDVVLWAQLADFATTYLGKGRLVYIEGRLQARQWQAADGSTRRTVEIVASRLQALTKGPTDAPAA